MKRISLFATSLFIATFALLLGSSAASYAELPPFEKVSEGYTEIPVSDQLKDKGLFNVWQKEKEAQLIGELPKNFAGKDYFLALTVSSGDAYAGLQSGDWVIQWRRYGDRLAVISPNLDIRATGDAESKASVKRLFTDQVLLDLPILAMGPNGGPVIDLKALLVDNASRFFGASVRITNSRIQKIDSAKVFPENVEIAFEIVGDGGKLQSIHYSFSEVPSAKDGYKPRVADERIGYFVTSFSDLSKYEDEDTRVRYVNRWNLQKRDPKLKLSPPKEPIRFYVEHTAPVRYRRWIKNGVDYWNKAFEKVGLVDAIVIEYQDAESGVHMEKDPEDVRYNFIRWLNNDVGTAIGPSRVHPETGQILDADIILTDGWIRHFNFNYHDLMPTLAMEGTSPETLAWLAKHPNWDPRIRFAPADRVAELQLQFAREAHSPMAGLAMAQADPTLMGDQEYDGLFGQISQKNGLCMAATGKHLDLAIARMNWSLALLVNEELALATEGEEKEQVKEGEVKEGEEGKACEEDKQEEKEKEKDDQDKESKEEKEVKDDKETADKADHDLLDGMPEWFVGPLLADLVAHEVGHTLGLRHNFKGSALRTLDEINSKNVKGKKTFASSVMDYSPINYRFESGEVQGDYAMIDIGPYDYWAIEYGYTFDDSKLADILKRCTEPELQYATDEDTTGPDPLARRYDFAADPLSYANEQMKLVKLYREKLLDRFVKDGDSWAKARRGYELTLAMQTKNTSMMANWIGGAFVYRDKKGDPGNRAPVEVVPAKDQRDALQFVINTCFNDDAFGLTSTLLERMSVDKWLDGDYRSAINSEATWPIHDRILSAQASALTLLMNPTTLRRVYDNEMRLPAEEDALTLPELLDTVGTSVWTELSAECPENRDDRKPMISSLRRNLQREHLQRLFDLVLEQSSSTAAYKPISNLARLELVDLQKEINESLGRCGEKMDTYTRAHLSEASERIKRVLEAGYNFNSAGQSNQPIMFMFGKETGSSGTDNSEEF